MGAKHSIETEPPGGTRLERLSRYLKSDTNGIVARWQERSQSTQLCAVCRHPERADALWAYWKGVRWTQTEDFARWPLDPPLSDVGLEDAGQMGEQIAAAADANFTSIHVVVTSPYFRCIQTAAEICAKLGSGVRVLVDHSLGEVYGPAVMGDTKPANTVRPRDHLRAWCRSRGVRMMNTSIGDSPTWPEDFRSARRRYAERFLTFLHRGFKAKRNFVLVSHADCVGAALSMMPSEAHKMVESVDYGGFFLATCRHDEYAKTMGHDEPPRTRVRQEEYAACQDVADATSSRTTNDGSFMSVAPTPPTVPMPAGASGGHRPHPPKLSLASLAAVATIRKSARKPSGLVTASLAESTLVPEPPSESAPDSPHRARAHHRTLTRKRTDNTEPGSQPVTPGAPSHVSTSGALPALPSPQRSPARTPRLSPVNKCADPELPEEPESTGREGKEMDKSQEPESTDRRPDKSPSRSPRWRGSVGGGPGRQFTEEEDEEEHLEPVWQCETEKALAWVEGEDHAPPQPVASDKRGDGWTLEVHNVKMCVKPGKKAGLVAFRKRVQQLGRTSSYSVSQIEGLLLNMNEKSLGVGDGIDEVGVHIQGTPSLNSIHQQPLRSMVQHPSVSTYLFGMSDPGSDMGSDYDDIRRQTTCKTEDNSPLLDRQASEETGRAENGRAPRRTKTPCASSEAEEACISSPLGPFRRGARLKSGQAPDGQPIPISPRSIADKSVKSLSLKSRGHHDTPAQDGRRVGRIRTALLPEGHAHIAGRVASRETSGQEADYPHVSLRGFCDIMHKNDISSGEDTSEPLGSKVALKARFDSKTEDAHERRAERGRPTDSPHSAKLTGRAAGEDLQAALLPLTREGRSARHAYRLGNVAAAKPQGPGKNGSGGKELVSLQNPGENSLLMRRRQSSGPSPSMPPLATGQAPASSVVRFALNIGQ